MKLTELNPECLKFISDSNYQTSTDIKDADGIMFLCPKCFKEQAEGKEIHVHSIICWKPSVPQTAYPKPGRWNLIGNDFNDLSLINGSSSVYLKGSTCGAHFFVKNGQIL